MHGSVNGSQSKYGSAKQAPGLQNLPTLRLLTVTVIWNSKSRSLDQLQDSANCLWVCWYRYRYSARDLNQLCPFFTREKTAQGPSCTSDPLCTRASLCAAIQLLFYAFNLTTRSYAPRTVRSTWFNSCRHCYGVALVVPFLHPASRNCLLLLPWVSLGACRRV